ncbi:ribonuclease J [Bauldia sp.]|uniref:ribonuclease J n=1 Tax=Bauldia sp. TaxID=2575872 RepID=UPI003BA93292
MNLSLYGYGPADDRTWIAVDFGIAFAGDEAPGAEVIFPDIGYLEEERTNLAAIFITHAHEDHYGALIELWPQLRVPVYATAFTAGLLNAKLASEPGADVVPVTVVRPGQRIKLGPFDVEYINVAHSIPEANALAIRTPAGLALHSGDWKLDDTPVVGLPTDVERLKVIGEEGVTALICDSTNAYREGRSPSEQEVAREIEQVVAAAKGRVAFTTFSSNVGRLRSVALAAAAAGREVVVVGRAIRRVLDVAAEQGMLDGLPPFREEEAFHELPRKRVLALLTGSQGEARAALARIAANEHRNVSFDAGDLVVFSSRTIPGNEVAINTIINALVSQGVRVQTDRDRLVHVSGHPRREELRHFYDWLKPDVAVPVHGEALHLAAHAELARDLGVPTVLQIENGAVVRLAPGRAAVIDDVPTGRLYRDGRLIGAMEDLGIVERRRLAFAGQISVSLVLDRRGNLIDEPDVVAVGLPESDAFGRPMVEALINAAEGAIESIPRSRRKHAEIAREAVRRAVRAEANALWGKKPNCTVFLTVV